MSRALTKLPRLIRKLRWMPDAKGCEILAIDNGIEHLKHCFPENAQYFHLPVRGEKIYINMYILTLLIYFLTKRKKSGLGLRGIYVAAVAKYISPRVIVTMIDNNNWDTNLSRSLGIPIVYTANGLRHPSHFWGKSFDCYFAMNTALIDPQLSFNNSFKQFYPAGHIKVGLYYEKNRNHRFTSVKSNTPTLLWISQYRDSIYNSDKLIHKEQKQTELMGVRYLSKYASLQNCNQRIAIASGRKNMDKNAELDYFNSVANDDIEFSQSSSDDWTSYDELTKSDLAIGMFSTLLFEGLSIDKRVLFLLPDNCKSLRQHISESIRLDLLAPLVCSKSDFNSFAELCTEILSMSDDEYLALIADFKSEVACFDKTFLPQQQIKNKLLQIIGV
ncbi:MAG: hypothetical protein ACR2QW_07115 [bacterium]